MKTMKSNKTVAIATILVLGYCIQNICAKDISEYTWEELDNMSVAEVKELLSQKAKEKLPELSTKEQAMKYVRELFPNSSGNGKIMDTLMDLKDNIMETGHNVAEAIKPNIDVQGFINEKIESLSDAKDKIIETGNKVVDAIKPEMSLDEMIDSGADALKDSKNKVLEVGEDIKNAMAVDLDLAKKADELLAGANDTKDKVYEKVQELGSEMKDGANKAKAVLEDSKNKAIESADEIKNSANGENKGFFQGMKESLFGSNKNKPADTHAADTESNFHFFKNEHHNKK